MVKRKQKQKPIGEIIAGALITGVGGWIAATAATAWPDSAVNLVFAVPILVVGLVVLLSHDATKSGETIFKLLSRS